MLWAMAVLGLEVASLICLGFAGAVVRGCSSVDLALVEAVVLSCCSIDLVWVGVAMLDLA